MNQEAWLEEDKKLLNSSIAFEHLDRFMSGDLEMPEIYGELYIKISNR
jgi:hypothetical protein